MMGKICERCFREYFEEDGPATPAEKLGRIFLGAVQDQDARNVCPECRNDLGILTLLGFDQ